MVNVKGDCTTKQQHKQNCQWLHHHLKVGHQSLIYTQGDGEGETVIQGMGER